MANDDVSRSPGVGAAYPEWTTEWGRAYVAPLASLKGSAKWETVLSLHRKGHRFFEILEETITEDVIYRYIVLEDSTGIIRGIQPFFLVNMDPLAGIRRPVGRISRAARAMVRQAVTMRMLMVGSPVGEGFLGASPGYTEWCIKALIEVLGRCANLFGASLIVLKEFDARLRTPMASFVRNGYVRIPSMPNCMLNLPFKNFDEYMQVKLGPVFRKNLRRKFRKAAEAGPLVMEAVTDLSPYADEVYPLYLQVYERAALRFSKLTPGYFRLVGAHMPDKMRFFIWRLSGKAVAFSVCALHDGALWDENLGLDYSVAGSIHLYFVTFRDLIEWCLANGVKRYYSTALSYDPKLHFKCDLVPSDLYVHHTLKPVNWLVKNLFPLLGPTRRDMTLRKFSNWKDL